jgi:hypothetical protein
MITINFTATLGDQIIFSKQGEVWETKKALVDFLTKNVNVAKSAFVMTLGNNIIVKHGTPSWTICGGGVEEFAKHKFIELLLHEFTQRFDWKMKAGTKGRGTAISDLVVSWECTRNGPRPARAKDVIAAEKAALAVKHAARRARSEENRKRAEQERANLRQRVKNQVDHAFAVGKHGTEPAAKFITCGHCSAPAVLLGLGERLAGAQVINEDAIVGVVCGEHNKYTWFTQNWVEKIPYDRLEFFYDGVRQIAVKAA